MNFCNEYLTNPVYRKLRERRAGRAQMERHVERGILPQIITLEIGVDIIIPGG